MITKYKLLILSAFINAALHAAAPLAQEEHNESGKTKLIQIMTHAHSALPHNSDNIAYAETQNLAADLNIPEIARYFGCKTLLGNAFLTETLQLPLSPEDTQAIIQNRQNAIQALVKNPDLKMEVERLISHAHLAEQEIIALLSDHFTGKNCPELKQLAIIKEQNPVMLPFMELIIKNRTGKTIATALNVVAMGSLLYSTALVSKITYALAQRGFNYTESACYAAYLGLMSGFTSYAVYKDYTLASEKRIKLHALNEFIAIAERCEALCAAHDIKSQFKISAMSDKQGINLVQGLKHNRYKHKNTIFFQTPAVHSFLYTVFQHDKHLAELFACVAEMDAYNAIATKMIEPGNAHNTFCFAHVVEEDKPVIQAQGFWNVLVPQAVPNSITETKQIILTGPNAGGKTTAIRALLQNIVLAQTFGIAAAQSFELTMFHVIHSYLNISDDILKGNSLFVSEIKRAQEILQKIKSLEPHKKFFFALDELFTGTAAEDGQKCAYEFVKKLSEYKRVQFIYATHFDALKDLGKNGTFCINYKVDAPTKNADGKLVYPFTLSQGANDVNVALDIAREAGLFNI